MRFTRATGHEVVGTATATTIGTVGELVVDPGEHRVVALALDRRHGDGDTVLWDDVQAFGEDAVTVEDEDRVAEAPERVAELRRKDHRLLGKRVLTTAGEAIGEVADIDFDPGSGELTELVLRDDGRVAGARLRGVGSYAVVVAAEG